MSERVLNFSEFFTKYSKEGQDDKASLDNLTAAAANFEEGFDKDTYDQAPLGPKKPIASAAEMTPPQPGEQGSPAFTAETEDDMVAPEEMDSTETEDEAGPESEGSQTEEEEVPEPETGANPKKKMEESALLSFNQFVNEEAEDWGSELDLMDSPEDLKDPFDLSEPNENSEDVFGANPFSEDWDKEKGYDDEYEYCDDCGEPIYYTREGASCGCNM